MEEITSYKKMAMKTLINSARKIMVQDGIENVTIRKVGDLSGFNGATVYNHFENLEHLKMFACLSQFDEYIADLKNYVEENQKIDIQMYLDVWGCFIKHTSLKAEVFYNIFFNTLERDLSEYIKEYYQIFPFNHGRHTDILDRMLLNPSIEKRNIILLEALANEGYIKKEDVEWINDLTAYTYESILFRMYKNTISKEYGEERMRTYIKEILTRSLA